MGLTLKVEGFDIVKELFKSIGHELSASQVRGILDDAGQIVLKDAKQDIQFTGEIADDFKKDLAVYRDNRKSNKDAEFVIIGPRFKQYNIHGKPQKVALIAQHMTQGFQQTERITGKGQRRGKVMDQKLNPMVEALDHTKDEVNNGINKGVIKKLNKLKERFPELVI